MKRYNQQPNFRCPRPITRKTKTVCQPKDPTATVPNKKNLHKMRATEFKRTIINKFKECEEIKENMNKLLNEITEVRNKILIEVLENTNND